ncbi:MAG: hypothetical protein JOY61_05050 [Chloroflexi bacterium]|nr:hypothetical protein [Chloroflexota bacterium]
MRPEGLGVIPAGGPAFSQEPSANEVRPWPWQLLQGTRTSSAQRLVLIKLQAAAGQGGGLLTYDGDTGRGVLMLEDVAPGAEYTVWLVRGSQRVQLGSLQTDADGFGTFVLPRPLPVEQPERIEVTGADSASSSVLTGTF